MSEMTKGTILVSGVSRGLGESIALHLLENGYPVLGLSRSMPASRLQNFDGFAHWEVDLEDLQSLEESVSGKFAALEVPLQGVVNNAAVAYDDLLSNMRRESVETLFRINVFAPMLLCKFAIRNFLLNGIRGSLVHIGSVCTHTGYKGLTMYGASKAALEGLSINLAREWGSRGIRSNCLICGFMDTDMNRRLDLATRERIYRRTALGKPTEPSSVAEMVRFLISPASDSMTGACIRVDSGTL